MFPLRLFQRESYDYKEIFSQHIRSLRALQSRERLLETALGSLAAVFEVSDAAVLLRARNGTHDGAYYDTRAHLGAAPVQTRLTASSPVVRWLQSHPEPLCLDDLNEARMTPQADRILRVFVELKAAALLPLQINQKLLGIIAVGAPPGRRFFNQEEKDLMAIFGFEIAIAIQNAYLYEEVLRQNAQLKELSAMKDSFISRMTHELATPLHNMIGLARALADGDDGPVSESQQQHLEIICAAGEQLLKIHRAILDLSQLENDPKPLTVKKLNLGALVAEWLLPYAARAQERGLELRNHIDATLPRVYGDAALIRRVFEELLDNGLRLTSAGHIGLKAEPLGDGLRVTIEDTGIGIDATFHENVFEAFRQVDGGLTRQYGGVGLGLTVAKKIVELHGGRLWLESQPGQGSRFYFTLPTRPANIRALEVKG